jgi:drug/metabolite transporter (DMT)-like permease
LGLLLSLASASFFGISSIFARIGMRRRASDDGHFMSVVVNMILLGGALLFVSLPRLDGPGLVAFVLAGLLSTGLGRRSAFKSVRLIGPARQGAFYISAPLFTALAEWLALGTTLAPLQIVGGLVVLGGLGISIRSRMAAEAMPVAAVGGLPDEDLGTSTRRSFTWGAIHGTLAAFFFGVGIVVRKYGITQYPSALAGAFLGASAALFMILATSLVRGRLRQLVRDNLRDIPWWFVATGLATGVALFLQFSAFLYFPAWLVSLFLGTTGLWTLLWSYLFLREEEGIGWQLVVSIVLVAAGAALMTVRP